MPAVLLATFFAGFVINALIVIAFGWLVWLKVQLCFVILLLLFLLDSALGDP